MKMTRAIGAMIALLVVLPVDADCGKERWNVKTGSDPTAAAVNFRAVVPATVADLVLLSRDTPTKKLPNYRTTPPESTVYEVTGRLINYKVETGRGDSDYHLVLQETEGLHCTQKVGSPTKVTPVPCTIVAEVPDPECVGAGSPFRALIARARTRLSARFPRRSKFGKKDENAILTVTGVGFFDRVHNQRGVAANGFELHPVLDVAFPDEEDEDSEVGAAPVVPLRPQPPPAPSKVRPMRLAAEPSPVTNKRPELVGETLSVGLTALLYVPFILAIGGAFLLLRQGRRIDTARFQMLLWFGVLIASVIGATLVAAVTSRHATDIEIPSHVLENLLLVVATAMFSDRTKLRTSPTSLQVHTTQPPPARSWIADVLGASVEQSGLTANTMMLGTAVVTTAVYAVSVWEALTGGRTATAHLLPDVNWNFLELLAATDTAFVGDRLLRMVRRVSESSSSPAHAS